MSEILDQTLQYAKEILGAEVLDLKIERAVVGLFFSGVKLSGGACGLSYTPLKSLSGAVCCPSQASVMPDSGNIAGKSVRYLLRDLDSAAPLKKTLIAPFKSANSALERNSKILSSERFAIRFSCCKKLAGASSAFKNSAKT